MFQNGPFFLIENFFYIFGFFFKFMKVMISIFPTNVYIPGGNYIKTEKCFLNDEVDLHLLTWEDIHDRLLK